MGREGVVTMGTEGGELVVEAAASSRAEGGRLAARRSERVRSSSDTSV